MKRSTVQRMSLAAATLMLAAGCAAGPQRSPAPTAPPMNNVSSTTGVEDACAAALGNAPTTTTGIIGRTTGVTTPGTTGVTTPGTTGTTTPGTTGTTAPGTTGTTAPGVTGVTTPRTTATTTGNQVTANGVIIGNVALVSLPTTEGMMTTPGTTAVRTPGATTITPGKTTTTPGTTTTTPGTTAVTPGTTTTTPGTAATPPATAGAATTASASLDRIRTACTRVVQIRVVTDATDRARLARVTQSVRRGVPVTDLMDELVTVNRKATVAWSGGPGTAAPTTTGSSMTVPPPGGTTPPR